MKCMALFAGLMIASASAPAQYPNKPVRVVIPFVVASSTDTITRIITDAMAKGMGQPVIIDNKPGADAMIAGADVVKARADGYTLLIGTGSQAAVPALRKSPPYDPVADFTPVADIGRFSMFLYVNADVPAKSFRELLAYARANPGKLNYATSSVSNIVASAQMHAMGDIKLTAVPYKSSPQAMLDLVTGRVQVMWDPPTTGMPYVKDGKLRVLVTGNVTRSGLLPEVPTIYESGMPQFSMPAWMGVLGPAKLPRDIADRLNREVVSAMKRPEVMAETEKQAFFLNPSSPARFGEFFLEQIEVHSRILRAAGVEQQ